MFGRIRRFFRERKERKLYDKVVMKTSYKTKSTSKQLVIGFKKLERQRKRRSKIRMMKHLFRWEQLLFFLPILLPFCVYFFIVLPSPSLTPSDPSLQTWLTLNEYSLDVATDCIEVWTFEPGTYRMLKLHVGEYVKSLIYVFSQGSTYDIINLEEKAEFTYETSFTLSIQQKCPEVPHKTFETENGYILAFEDGGAKEDYNDLIVSLIKLDSNQN